MDFFVIPSILFFIYLSKNLLNSLSIQFYLLRLVLQEGKQVIHRFPDFIIRF